ncbi:uncharacterized protein SPAPADRAFT_65461 [Spathaspora passalidarum NRRL Y-27907]|uniref:Exonuclease V, mitochondrial n=1 Tax=Spathaspora passalidarum (strain NRRL Y-27907 / 11-Y1) TaxID=619300 RepID=G3AHZ7_SPAPN|nr:uncharacterized protein SPAPADRAFT_65461 [Spathaspora passalidarum NRRL Y-27907]EGW34311.1 hypothetical protein SPAPADRAFT_65461 [Spathaspora passalidarum NRRL Y-27907]
MMKQLSKQFQRKLHISPVVSLPETTKIHIPTQEEEDAEIHSILVKLVKPKDDTPPLTDPSLIALYNNWRLPVTSQLPLQSPNKELTPFEFYSKHNSSKSYVNNPRLGVTRMLNSSWCELRQYYQIYAGSPTVEPTEAMQMGSEVHLNLEREIHPEVDVTTVEMLLKENFKKIRDRGILTNEQSKMLNHLIFTSEGRKQVTDWADAIIGRLFTLLTTGEAREIMVHGYINFDQRVFVHDIEELPRGQENKKVLISGIVDHFILENKDLGKYTYFKEHESLFDDFDEYLSFEMPEFKNEEHKVDLNKFFESAREIVHKHKDKYNLILTDVKTRKSDFAPKQQSVLASAKLQTFYYRHMFELLSGNPEFGYYSLLANAQKKGFNIDEPLSIIAVFTILRSNYKLFFTDFMKLANGEPIGFAPYDSDVNSEPYEFGKVFQMSDEFSWDTPKHDKFLQRMGELDTDVDYQEILVPLLRTWKTAPTLRYLAARASQFYNLFHGIAIPKTKIEYTSTQTGKVFETRTYSYNYDELESSIEEGCSFWDGSRDPEPTIDLSRCTYCQFKSKCVVPNGGGGDKTRSRTDIVRQFLHDYEEPPEDLDLETAILAESTRKVPETDIGSS